MRPPAGEDRHHDGRTEEVLRELTRRRADLVDHARGSLEEHLVGVRALLRRWQQPEHVQLAGLLHSAYATDGFRFRLFGRTERPRVRELVGVRAERLVFAFCACTRDELLAKTGATSDPVSPAARWEGVTVRLDRAELAELMVIHAANLAEQACLGRGSPSRWLSVASTLLAAARPKLGVSPGVLAAPIDATQETALLAAYRAALRSPLAAGQGVRTPVVTSAVGEPLVIAATRALAQGQGDEAASLAERALSTLGAWGVAWDKRLRFDRWQELAERVLHDGRLRDRELVAAARRMTTAFESARGSPARLWASLDATTPVNVAVPALPRSRTRSPARPSSLTEPPVPERFARYIAGLRTNSERPMLQFYPGLRATPWHDAHDTRAFPIVADLERLAPEIAREMRTFDPSRFQDEAEGIDRTGRWGVLFLLEMGRRNEENLARCPSLRWILEHHRTLTTHAGLMYFSCLDPHTRVEAHQGPTNVRVRCHLGLDVPEGCGIRVGGLEGRWQEGRCLVLDDSFIHEVWNDSDRRRVVLVLDLWHPDLDEREIELLAGLHRYGAANSAGARRYWARNDEARRERDAELAASRPTPDGLDALIGKALRAGDLPVASERALQYAQLCRPTRWYPVARDTDPPLPTGVPWPRVLTPSKLVHDIEQLSYLRDHGILANDVASIIDRYEGLLDTLRPLGADARVPLVGIAEREVGHVYNRLVHVRSTPRTPEATTAVSTDWDRASVEQRYIDGRPNVVVIDDFLTPGALESLRLFCLESTIWSTNRYDHGRLGSFFRDGFNCPLLVQIAEELRAALPRVIGTRHPVTQIWGYKYATTQPALPPHADFAAVNVNFWITPDDANLEPGAGGLVMYDVAAPTDWDFATYNRDGARIRELLAKKNAQATHIPYRQNRAVIFDSDLFHTTPSLRFRSGYEDRRINVTFLFGDRLAT